MKKFIVISVLSLTTFGAFAQSSPAKVESDYKSGTLTVEEGALKQSNFKLNADFMYVKRNNDADGTGVRLELNKKMHLAPFDSLEPGVDNDNNKRVSYIKDRYSNLAISPDLSLDLQAKGKEVNRLDLSGAKISLFNYELQGYKDAYLFKQGTVPAENLSQTLSLSGPSAILIYKDVKDIKLSQKGVQFSPFQVSYHGAVKIGGVNFDGCIGLNPVNAIAGKVEGRGSEDGINSMNTKIIACAGVNLGKVAHVGYQFSADVGWDGSRTLSHEVSVSKIGHEKNPIRISGASRTDTNVNGQGVTTKTVGIGVAF